jgi:dihydrodipicolinate synthase/N-acetylneuraminate lyase
LPDAHGQLHELAQVLNRGVHAASVTPFLNGGATLDEEAIGPIVDFLAAGGVEGLLALGTTGEGILLSVPERKRAVERFIEASAGRLQIAVHAGAQTTADTVALAAHAAEAGADAVAVIGPPYFKLDERSQVDHFVAAAAACAPTPFYLYEFEQVAGYSILPGAIAELCDRVPNLTGLKVSNTTFERVSPFLLEGLDVFLGSESLIHQGLAAGAAGAVSGLAAALPELVVAAVRDGTPEATARAGAIRDELNRFPRHPALKRILAQRGVPVREDVRAPLRALTDPERAELDLLIPTWLGSFATA